MEPGTLRVGQFERGEECVSIQVSIGPCGQVLHQDCELEGAIAGTGVLEVNNPDLSAIPQVVSEVAVTVPEHDLAIGAVLVVTAPLSSQLTASFQARLTSGSSTGPHRAATILWTWPASAMEFNAAVMACAHTVALYRKFGFVEEGRLTKHIRRADGELWDLIEMGLLL